MGLAGRSRRRQTRPGALPLLVAVTAVACGWDAVQAQRPPEPPTFCSATAPRTGTSRPDLIGWWRFDSPRDEQDAITAEDWSASGTTLWLTRFSFQHPFTRLVASHGIGHTGAAQLFGRSDLSTTLSRSATGISLWTVRAPGTTGIDLIAAVSGITISTLRDGSQLRVSAPQNGSPTGRVICSVPLPPVDPYFLHIAASVNGSALICSVNGTVRVATGSINMSAVQQSTSLRIGGTTHWQFIGYVDEVQVFDGPLLSPRRIAQLAATPLPSVNLPPIPYGGLPQTVWKPVQSVALNGSCSDPDTPQTALSVAWSLIAAPLNGAAFAMLRNTQCTTASLHLGPSAPAGDYVLQLTCSDGVESRVANATVVLFEPVDHTPGAVVWTNASSWEGFSGAGTPLNPALLFEFNSTFTACGYYIGGGRYSHDDCGTFSDSTNSSNGTFVGIRHQLNRSSAPGVHGTSGLFIDRAMLSFGNPEAAAAAAGSPWPEISVSFWFNTRESSKEYMFRKGSFSIDVSTTGQLAVSNRRVWTAITPNVWYHIVLVAAPELTRLIVNGSVVWTGAGVTRSASDAADNATFGMRPGANHPIYTFTGVVDDFALYNVALSPAEAERLYRQPASSVRTRSSQSPGWLGGYSPSFIRQYFPAIAPVVPDYSGADPDVLGSGTPPLPNAHPRIFFTRDMLPGLRHRLRYTASGIAAMGNLRGLIAEELDARHPRTGPINITLQNMGNSHDYVNEAFRVVVDADTVGARRLIATLVATVPDIHALLNATTCTEWQNCAHDAVLRTGIAVMYDFLHPWMSLSERAAVRGALARATQGRWAVGMDALAAQPASTSNWVPWVTGDLGLNLMAIEGEDGYDAGVAARVRGVMHHWVTLGVDPESGAPYEGMGKNAIALPKLVAYGIRGHAFAGAPAVRRHYTRFLLHSMLPTGTFIEDGLWGGSGNKPNPGDAAAAKALFPSDPKIDFVYRNGVSQSTTDLSYYALTPARMTLYAYSIALTRVIFARDYFGPANWSAHAALATAGEPLTFVANSRGMVVARTSWTDPDATVLWVQARSSPGGHQGGFRGAVVFASMGEVWVPYPTGNQNIVTTAHSLPLINGRGQIATPGRLLQVLDAPQATFAAIDLTQSYGTGGYSDLIPNDFLLRPSPQPWMNLTFGQLPGWYSGTYPSLGRVSAGAPRRVTRTVGLVKSGPAPFAVLLDDLQQGNVTATYTWRLFVGVTPRAATVQGSDLLLGPTDNRSVTLLLRVLPGSSPVASLRLNGNFVEIVSRGVAAQFRVLLMVLPTSTSPRPVTTWNAATREMGVTPAGAATSTVLTLGTGVTGGTAVVGVTEGGVAVPLQPGVWTEAPTASPTLSPTAVPSMAPSTAHPTVPPSAAPTQSPTARLTQPPSRFPTRAPTTPPPTRSPTRLPTPQIPTTATPTAATNLGASANGNGDGGGAGETHPALLAVTVVLVAVAVGSLVYLAVVLKQRADANRAATSADASRATAFDNPVYAVEDGETENPGAYLDVVPNEFEGGNPGAYMDISPIPDDA